MLNTIIIILMIMVVVFLNDAFPLIYTTSLSIHSWLGD